MTTLDPVNRTGSLTVTALLMAALLICGPLMVTENAQAKSEGDVDNAHPTSAYANQTVAFSIELTNTGDNAFTITKAVYVIEWDEDNITTVTLKGNTSVAASETVNLTGSFVTPDVAPATYEGNVNITAREGVLLPVTTELSFDMDFTIIPVPPLTVSILASPASGTVPLDVTFTSEVEGGIGPYTYAWSAGDGSTGDGSTFEHRYAEAGRYDATLVVTDSRGTTSSASLTVHAGATELIATIQATVLNGESPLTTTISSTVSGGVGPYTYYWTTGDGGTFDVESFTYEYHEPGTYTVRLLVTDSQGVTDRDLITIVVLTSNDEVVAPDAGDPLDISGVLIIYIFVFAVASVTVVGFMIYMNRTRFRR